MFIYYLGPLTREGTNIVLGELWASRKFGDTPYWMRYTTVRDNAIQNWIRQLVPDVEILGMLH